jgi:hypothetical protein
MVLTVDRALSGPPTAYLISSGTLARIEDDVLVTAARPRF